MAGGPQSLTESGDWAKVTAANSSWRRYPTPREPTRLINPKHRTAPAPWKTGYRATPLFGRVRRETTIPRSYAKPDALLTAGCDISPGVASLGR